MTKPVTPCIGICSTSIGDPVCRGCKRFNHEVFHWNGYTSSEKTNVLTRLEDLLEKVLNRHITVTDEVALDAFLANRLTRPPALKGKAAKTFLVLRILKDQQPPQRQREQLKASGIVPNKADDVTDLEALFKQIEQEYYTLSLAYYDANFLRAYRTGARSLQAEKRTQEQTG